MATELNNMYLASGGTLALAFGTSATKVYGSVDADKITIAAGVTVVLDGSFNRGNDTIQFTGNAASYSVVRVNASTVRITDAAGTSVTIPVGSAGTQIQFADATRTLSGSSAGIVLGDQAVSSTAAALAQGTSPAGEFILTSSAPTVAEGSNGTKTLTYLLQLNKAPTSELSLNYKTTDAGTAKAGDDFQVVAGLVTFAPGQTAATVSVTVYGDTVVEADETVVLRVSGSKLVASVDAAGTIVNDDAAPVDPSSFTVSAGDIASANASSVPVTVNVGETGNKTVTIQSDGASASRGVIINGNANATITSGAAGDTITVSGNGNNTINSGAGNDTVNVYGTGTNTINVGAGTDTVLGGSGNDTIVFAAGQLRADDVVDGGAGIDTVRVSGDGNVIGTGLTNIENIVFDGTEVSISAAALRGLIEGGLKSISGSSATTELTITGLSSTLDLSKVTITGGLEKIITNGTGTLVLNTTQVGQIAEVTAASGTLTQAVVVTGVQTVAQADALIASGVTAKFAVEDTAANLALASAAVFTNAQSVKATTAATAAQAEAIATAASGFTVSATNFVLNVTDTAEQLATRTSGLGNAKVVTATTPATLAEANAIATATALGEVTTATSFAISDGFGSLVTGSANELLDRATSVTVTDTVTSLANLKLLNDAIEGTKTVAAGYAVSSSIADIILPANAAEANAASKITVTGGAISVTEANALEALNNTGANTYALSATATALNAAAFDVVTNGTSATSTDATLSVAQMNALVAKFGATKLADTTLTVVGTVAELATLSIDALKEIKVNADAGGGSVGKLVITAASTATVADVAALNAKLGTTYVGLAPLFVDGPTKYVLSDTVANLTAATGTAAGLAILNGGSAVALTDKATVKQIADLNTALTTPAEISTGYTVEDNVTNLLTQTASGAIIDDAGKVIVTGTASFANVEAFRAAFGGSPVMGTDIVYTLKDAAGTLTAATSGNPLAIRDGATAISINDSSVNVATALALRSLPTSAKFDGVYAISTNVSDLNGAYTTGGATLAATQAARSVTLVGSVNNLTGGAADLARGRATSTIAFDTLDNLSAASSALKAAVNGFSVDGAVAVTSATNVAAVNALSALKPTTYAIASASYSQLNAGDATFVAKAASLNVTGDVTIAQANTLLGKISGTVVYNIVDTAANIAGASSAVLKNDSTPQIDTAGTAAEAAAKAVVNVAQATILTTANITGYTIADTAAKISAAKASVVTGAAGGIGAGVVVTDGGYTSLTVEVATKVYGATGNATADYDLVDTAFNLDAAARANPALQGYARNVTVIKNASGADATAAEAQAIALVESRGTITYDVSDSAGALLANTAGLNGARNVVATGNANLAQAVLLQGAANSGTLTYKILDSGVTIADALLTTSGTTKADAITALNGATTVDGTAATVNGAQATALAAQDKAIVYNISTTQTELSETTVSAGALTEAKNITVTGAVTSAFAAQVLAANPGVTSFTGTVSGTSASLAALQLGALDSITTLTATTASTVAEAKAIVAINPAATYGLRDTAANLAAAAPALLNAAVTIAPATTDIVATTPATAAEAIVIAAATPGAASFEIADSYSNLMANSDRLKDVDADAAMTTATKVTVTDGSLTLAQATDLVAVGGTLSRYVYSVTDRDAALATAITADSTTLLNATSVTGENGKVYTLDSIGGAVYLVGTKAELAALPPELKAANVEKLVVASVADLNADPLYYSTLSGGTFLRVTDSYENLTSGNATVSTATSVIVTGSVTAAQAAVINGYGATEKEYSLSDTVGNLNGNAASNGAINIVATGTATFAQANSIVNASNTGTTTIAGASMNAADAQALNYASSREKITSLTVTGTANYAQASAVIADVKAGNVGSATYSLSDTGAALVVDSSTGAAVRNGATNITATTTTLTTAEAQLILSATNSGTTTVAAVSGTAKQVAALIAGSNDTITTITVTGTATVAEAVAIAALDARTGTTVNYNFNIEDTAAAILAAPLAVLDAVTGVSVKGAVDVATAAQVLALNTADTSIIVNTLAVTDTAAALKLASVAVGAGATKVTVSGEAKVADITAIDTLFTGTNVDANAANLVYNLNDTYQLLGANPTVAAGSTKVTVSGTITVGQAAVAYAWSGATYNIKASPTSIANAFDTAHVKGAVSVLVDGSATVAEAAKLSEMTNLTAAGFTISDTAAEVYAAYNRVNASGAKDIETLALAKSINLNNGATVEELVGTASQDGISRIVAAYTLNDSAALIGAALASPSKSALIEFATKVSSTTAGATVANIVAIQDIFGAKFVGYDDPNTLTVEKSYFLSDSALNLSIADEALINAAKSVTAVGTDGADTMNLSALSRGVTVAGGAGADTMTGTAVADTFRFAAGDSGTISGTVFDTITNYAVGVGGDVLDLVGTPAVRANEEASIDVAAATVDAADVVTASVSNGIITVGGTNAANVNTLGEWIAVARTVVTASGDIAAFVFGGDTYVYQENGTDTSDLLVQLDNVTGITGFSSSAAASNIIYFG